MAEVNKNIDNVKTKKTEILQKTWVVCALALVCTFLWGSASPCIKLGYAFFRIPSGETWTQVLFAGMRFVLAGILTVLIGSLLQRKVLVPTTASAPSIVKLAIFQTILQYIFFYIGLAHNSGVKASIINGSNTFFVILVSALIFRQEKLDLKKVLGCIIGFAGVIVVSMNGQKIDMDLSLMGDGSLFLCALSYAVSSCLMKKYSKRIIRSCSVAISSSWVASLWCCWDLAWADGSPMYPSAHCSCFFIWHVSPQWHIPCGVSC